MKRYEKRTLRRAAQPALHLLGLASALAGAAAGLLRLRDCCC